MLCVSSLVGSGWIFELENLLETEVFLSVCQIVCKIVGYRNYFLHVYKIYFLYFVRNAVVVFMSVGVEEKYRYAVFVKVGMVRRGEE